MFTSPDLQPTVGPQAGPEDTSVRLRDSLPCLLNARHADRGRVDKDSVHLQFYGQSLGGCDNLFRPTVKTEIQLPRGVCTHCCCLLHCGGCVPDPVTIATLGRKLLAVSVRVRVSTDTSVDV